MTGGRRSAASTSASFGCCAACRPGVAAAAVMVAAGVEQVGHLLQGEPEPLRGFDHPQHRDRLRRIQPVPAQAAIGFGQQPAPLVVPQGLQIDPGRGRDLRRSAVRAHAGPPARGGQRVEHGVWAGGTTTRGSSAAGRGEGEGEERAALSLPDDQVRRLCRGSGVGWQRDPSRLSAEPLDGCRAGEQLVELAEPQGLFGCR